MLGPRLRLGLQLASTSRTTLRRLAAPASSKTAINTTILPPKREEKATIDLDTERLCNYAAFDYLKEGDSVALRPDAEYPEWLWSLRTDKGPHLRELSEADGWAYWRVYLKEAAALRRLNSQLRIKYKAVTHHLDKI